VFSFVDHLANVQQINPQIYFDWW